MGRKAARRKMGDESEADDGRINQRRREKPRDLSSPRSTRRKGYIWPRQLSLLVGYSGGVCIAIISSRGTAGRLLPAKACYLGCPGPAPHASLVIFPRWGRRYQACTSRSISHLTGIYLDISSIFDILFDIFDISDIAHISPEPLLSIHRRVCSLAVISLHMSCPRPALICQILVVSPPTVHPMASALLSPGLATDTPVGLCPAGISRRCPARRRSYHQRA